MLFLLLSVYMYLLPPFQVWWKTASWLLNKLMISVGRYFTLAPSLKVINRRCRGGWSRWKSRSPPFSLAWWGSVPSHQCHKFLKTLRGWCRLDFVFKYVLQSTHELFFFLKWPLDGLNWDISKKWMVRHFSHMSVCGSHCRAWKEAWLGFNSPLYLSF